MDQEPKPGWSAAVRPSRAGHPAGVDLQHRTVYRETDPWADRGCDYWLSVEGARALRDALTQAIQEAES